MPLVAALQGAHGLQLDVERAPVPSSQLAQLWPDTGGSFPARGWGSDADADLAEKRFTDRLSRYRAGHAAPPAKWQVPGSCLAEVLNAPAVRGGKRR